MAAVAMDARAREAIRGLPVYQPGKPIEEVQRELGLRTVVKLASNENPLGPSPKAVSAMRKALKQLHRYPDARCDALRQRLAEHLQVDAASILAGNGSDELLVLALRAFVNPGDHVVVAQPTFLIYELQARAAGASVTTVPLTRYRYDLPAMRRAVTAQTKLVFIANPDNPTGTYVTSDELEAFVKDLPPQTIVCLDEAYYEYVEANDYPQSLPWIGRWPLIVTRTFSKAYGLAGLRVGFCVAQPSLIRAMDVVREPFNVNRLAQVAAAAALDDTLFLQKTKKLAQEGRRYVCAELSRLGLQVIPSVTNFLLVEVGTGAAALAKRLLEEGVIVREMSAWKLGGHLRVTIGTMSDNRRLTKAIKRCLRAARHEEGR